MIEPTPHLVPLEERPVPKPMPWWVEPVCFFAAPLVVRWIEKREARLLARVRDLLSACRACRSREELEAVLGPPQYSLVGHNFKINGESPDLVEIYSHDDCRIEILFRDGTLWSTCGSPEWSYLAVVGSRLLPRRRPNEPA